MTYLSPGNIQQIPGNAKADIYLLQSTNLFEHSLCFDFREGSRHGSSSERIYCIEFAPKDPRKALASLIPQINAETGALVWPTSCLCIREGISDEWKSSVKLNAIASGETFMAYQRWLISWLEENKYYTVIDGGSTIKRFITDSLMYLDVQADVIVPIRIDTYFLSYKSRERCDPSELFSIGSWFASLEEHPKSLHGAIAWLRRQEMIYYHEGSVWGSRYWRITCPNFILQSTKIELPLSSSPPPFLSNPLLSNPSPPSSPLIDFIKTIESKKEEAVPAPALAPSPALVSVSVPAPGPSPVPVLGSRVINANGMVVACPCPLNPSNNPAVIVPSETSTALIAVIVLVVILIIVLFIVIIYLGTRGETSPGASTTTFVQQGQQTGDHHVIVV